MVEDEVCISRAQAGDEEAFAELMQAYYAYVYTVVIKIVSNPHDAEEVVQETFFNAYRGLPQLEDRSKFKGWLAEIARNRARNWRRSQRVDTVSLDEVGEHTLQNPEAVDDKLIRDEQRELIRRAMETLSEKDREIAHSYYLEGASYDELIQTHGLSYKAISFRLSRAKQRLTKRLKYLLTGLSLPPVTTLKQLYSGGLTVMKVGTAPKLTMAAIGIVTLIFIGSHQFLSSKDKHSASVEGGAPTSDTTAQSVSQTDAARQNAPTAPSSEAERPISEQERQQIKNFFSQLEESDPQTETVVTQSATESEPEDESVATAIDVELLTTGQAAEDVMEDMIHAYVEAYKNLDFEALLPLVTGTAKETLEFISRDFNALDPERARGVRRRMQAMYDQTEIVGGEYVGEEFHFRLKTPLSKMPEFPAPLDIKMQEMPKLPDSIQFVVKIRKEDGAWKIYADTKE